MLNHNQNAKVIADTSHLKFSPPPFMPLEISYKSKGIK